MLKITLATMAIGLAGGAVAQTAEPATPAEPVMPAAEAQPSQPVTPAEPATPPTTTGAGVAQTEALPRCSAEVRDNCLQDERFAADQWTPGPSRDNNAMRYRTSEQARRANPKR